MFELSHKLSNQWVKLVKFNFKDNDNVTKLNNIGLYINTIFYVKPLIGSKHVIHLLVNNIEYVLRTKDAKKIIVEVCYGFNK